jgi:hypothetical protein
MIRGKKQIPGTLQIILATLRVLTLVVEPSQATLFSIQDPLGGRPSLTSNDLPLNWWDGGPAYTLASASAVRINFRGVIAYPATARLRTSLNDRSLSTAKSKRHITGWHSVSCNLSASALCTADVGRVFPSAQNPLRIPDSARRILVDGWDDLSCSSSGDKLLTSKMVYDVSACDVMDEGLDILFSHGDIFHMHNSIPQWKYWTLVILSIVLVRFLSYNVQTLWDNTDESIETVAVRDQRPPLACSLVIVIIIIIDGDSTYITTADQLFFWCTIAYIAIYLAIHLWTAYATHKQRDDSAAQLPGDEHPETTMEIATAALAYEQPVYNMIVATLQLVAVRFYSSAETPYNIVLLAMLACRAW